MGKDFLDEMIAESTAQNPEFPRLLAEAKERRAKLRALSTLRAEKGLSQTEVAVRMHTSQSVVAHLESGEVDTKLSTLERYASALGASFKWSIS